MRTALMICLIVVIPLSLLAYEFEQQGESSSCKISLSIKLVPTRAEDETGRAIIEVFLREKGGTPIAGRQIQMTASWGAFYCRLPEEKDSMGVDVVDDQSCYTTDRNGKVKVNLVNLQFGESVQVKATCDCGGYFARATGNLSLKTTVKKR